MLEVISNSPTGFRVIIDSTSTTIGCAACSCQPPTPFRVTELDYSPAEVYMNPHYPGPLQVGLERAYHADPLRIRARACGSSFRAQEEGVSQAPQHVRPSSNMRLLKHRTNECSRAQDRLFGSSKIRIRRRHRFPFRFNRDWPPSRQVSRQRRIISPLLPILAVCDSIRLSRTSQPAMPNVPFSAPPVSCSTRCKPRVNSKPSATWGLQAIQGQHREPSPAVQSTLGQPWQTANPAT